MYHVDSSCRTARGPPHQLRPIADDGAQLNRKVHGTCTLKQPAPVDDILAVSTSWQKQLIGRLLSAANPDGSWGYRAGSVGSSEPTALACLALAAHDCGPDQRIAGMDWLASCQRTDGSVPVFAEIESPSWGTSLAVQAWLHVQGTSADGFGSNVKLATSWLLSTRGLPDRNAPGILGHDTSLRGWPWVAQTHSWIEPTAQAISALRATGRGDHPRVREGVRLILDRTLLGGGWNYGNTKVLGSDLRPFPATTGIALGALRSEPADSHVETSIEYLRKELAGVRSPQSLSWGLIGLGAWGRRPGDSYRWLLESATRSIHRAPNAFEDALLLLADAEHCPLTQDSVSTKEASSG